jgi:hypothetical protein
MQFISLVAGIVLILLAALVVGRYAYRRWAPGLVRARLAAAGVWIQVRAARVCRWSPPTPMLAVLVLAVFSGYALWISSAGKFPSFYSIDNYYVRLGRAFLHGQLYLLEKPGPELLALQNPFDIHQREGIAYLWDASLYQGKYSIYWGPVPGLAYAAVEALWGEKIAAQPPTAALLVGLVLMVLLLLVQIRRWFFPRAPALTVVLFLLAAAFCAPNAYILARTKVYETSILFGQFFLFLGLLFWVVSLKTGRTGWVALAGLGWGLAFGSRTPLAVSVAVYVGFALFHFWRGSARPRSAHLPWGKLAALLFPLAACVLALGWYNWARFGNPLEPGTAYQLTVDVPTSQYFSIRYLVPNLYTWLFYAPKIASSFPFLNVPFVANELLPSWAALPPSQIFDYGFMGVLPALPVLGVLALVLPVMGGRALRARSGRSLQAGQTAVPAPQPEFILMLGLAGVLQFGMLQLFFYGAGRYYTDFYFPLLLAAASTAWVLDDLLRARPGVRAVFWVGVALLVGCTAVVGYFSGFIVYPGYFESNNKHLYDALSGYWQKPGMIFFQFWTALRQYYKVLLRLIHFA